MARGRKSRTFTPIKSTKVKRKRNPKRNAAQKKASADAITKMLKKGYGRGK